MKELEQEVDELKATLEGVKGQLEAETLSKVDLQNNIQSLREDLAFKKKMYEEVGCCSWMHAAMLYKKQLALFARRYVKGSIASSYLLNIAFKWRACYLSFSYLVMPSPVHSKALLRTLDNHVQTSHITKHYYPHLF